MRAHSIMYHDVVENGDFEASGFSGEGAHVYKVRREDFARHLDAIASATGSATGTATGAATSGVTVIRAIGDLKGSPVLLTFDDGGVSFHHPIADLLEGRGWRGHFFITTDRIGTPGFLSESELRDLYRRGHVIGSHSCSHPTRMAALPRGELDREWRQSVARLSALVGEPIKAASVPGGYYSREVGESAAAAGIEVLFTSEPTAQATICNGCLVLGRYVIQRGMGPEWPGGFAAGRRAQCWRQTALWKAKQVAKTLGGSAYLKLRQAILERRK